jgi:hypothetical protein
MADLQGRVRDRLRERLLSHGAATAFEDPALFADVERLLQAAITTGDARTLLRRRPHLKRPHCPQPPQ